MSMLHIVSVHFSESLWYSKEWYRALERDFHLGMRYLQKI